MTKHEWHVFLNDLMRGIWIATILANIINAFVIVFSHQYRRWNKVLLWCISSVFIDFMFWWITGHAPTLYEPFRKFIFYCWTFMIEAMVIFEAFRRGERRIQYPVECQLAVGLAGLLKERYFDAWGVYYFDCISRALNLCVIVWAISILWPKAVPQHRDYRMEEEDHDGRIETTLPR